MVDRYRISLFSQWKQRGMYATCMWIVQLLLVLSKVDSMFIYAPEFYLEALVYRIFIQRLYCRRVARHVVYFLCLCCIDHIFPCFSSVAICAHHYMYICMSCKKHRKSRNSSELGFIKMLWSFLVKVSACVHLHAD